MRLIIFLFVFVIDVSTSFSQIFYTGTIDKFPIELILTNDGNNFTRGIYVYKNFDTPISISGNKQIDQWHLEVKNGKGRVLEQLKLYTDSLLKPKINGIWIDAKTNKMLDINLTQAFHLNNLYHLEHDSIEVLQAESTNNYYFKILLKYKNENNYSAVHGIKIYEKKTDVLIQCIDIVNEYRGIYSVSIGDYNFDGHDDFSIFETSYAGPNTSSNYYLYDAKTKKYFLSEITGVSLEFDSKHKTIIERNQCCAGSRVLITHYKLKSNKMILFKEECLVWDDKIKMLVKGNKRECQ